MLFVAMALISCNFVPQEKKASGPTSEKKISLTPFQKLDVGNVFHIEYSISDSIYAIITAPQSFIEEVVFTTDKDELQIEMKHDNVSYKFEENDNIIIKIFGPALSEISLSGMVNMQYPNVEIASMKVDISGMSNFQIPRLKADKLSFDISGASKLKIDSLDSRVFNLDISGISNVEVINGYVYEQNIDISGTGKYDAKSLLNKYSKVDMSGIGNATIWVDSFLSADVSGSANLNYKGNPTVKSSVSGIAKVNVIE